MIAFKHFDLANSFPIDYMHGVCIGIVPLLLDIWLGKKKLVYGEDETYQFKPLSVSQRIQLNKRILSLKPPTRISHKPRSILDRNFFTANEFRSLLWFYLRHALYGLLNRDLIKHFTLLSDATYILSKSGITAIEVSVANNMLNKFADDFQKFYGKNSITINIHMLRHYANAVLNTGPLFCHSMFCFESNIGFIKRSFNCTVDVVEQIAFNYSIRAASEKSSRSDDEPVPKILRLKKKQLTSHQTEMLKSAGVLLSDSYEIGYEMSFRNEVFKSTVSVITKSIDCFVEIENGTIGSIEMFLQLEEPCVVVKNNEVVKTNNHLKQIQPSRNNVHQIFPCNSISQKLIYLKFKYSNVSFIEIVTTEPNHFEGN